MHKSLVIPDIWQQQAVHALREGSDVVVHAPTGSGKTYIFELLYGSSVRGYWPRLVGNALRADLGFQPMAPPP